MTSSHSPVHPVRHWLGILAVFLRLGLTSFGGPVAHLGYFREAFVTRRGWLDERGFADLVALSQFLPGPASSQVGLGIGFARGGIPGAIAAWLGFTLPSAVALAAFGYGLAALGGAEAQPWLHGLKVVAVAVVAQAVWGMARRLTPDVPRVSVAVAAAIGVLMWPSSLGQVVVIILGALAGRLVLPQPDVPRASPIGLRAGRTTGAAALLTFAVLLLGLPLAAEAIPAQTLRVADAFYRAGSLVFGGGHVVLPLLQSAVVTPGWVTQEHFLAGYGAAQAIPGPLVSFAAFLGTVMTVPPQGWLGAALCLVAIYVPSFLLIIGMLPFWEVLRRIHTVQSALLGVNAAVVGLLLAALYDPVWRSAIRSPMDFALALAAFTLLVFWRVPPWLVVLLTAAGGTVSAFLPLG